jgi:Holliday junction resolvasome RuvABC endonuclease subunit
MPNDATVIGLDLSLTGSGVASSNGWCERVGITDVTTRSLGERIVAVDHIANQVLALVGRATLVCLEVPAFSRAGGGALERGALWWLVARSLRNREIPVAEIFNQHRMRYATGKGSASKGAIVDAVARRWPQFETGGDDNLADAAVLAAMGADWLGHPLAPMPATHRRALDGVKWPDALDPANGPLSDEQAVPVGLGGPSYAEEPTTRFPHSDAWPIVGQV